MPRSLERGNRIELSALAWKAKVLPLYEPRKNLAYPLGLEPRLTVLETAMLPLHYGYNLVEETGIEPATYCLQSNRSPN